MVVQRKGIKNVGKMTCKLTNGNGFPVGRFSARERLRVSARGMRRAVEGRDEEREWLRICYLNLQKDSAEEAAGA